MASPTAWLVTGAGRGIGKELVAKLLLKPGLTVVATVRDVGKAKQSLNELPKAEGSKLVIVKLDSQVDTDAREAVAKLRSDHGITFLDVAVANAGIAHSGTTVSGTNITAFRDHINTNTIGPITLFQAVSPLLKASHSGNPIFLGITTVFGSIGGQDLVAALPPVLSPYGASKAALNWIVQRLHREENWLTSFVVHPGLVLTDMGSAIIPEGANPKLFGAITVEESVENLLNLISQAKRETEGGIFKNYDGNPLPW